MPKTIFKLDWLTILIFIILVAFGWANIFSTTLTVENPEIFDLSTIYGKQLLWILLSIVLIVLVLALEAKFYMRFASVFYAFAMLSLIGLLFFGKTIAGQTAWYSFGSFSIQPAEFVKTAVALMIAKYLTGININLKNFTDQVKVLAIIALPMALILLQPDAGSALIYVAFVIPLYREGLPHLYLIIGSLVISIFILTLKFGFAWILLAIIIIALLISFFRRKEKINYIFFSFFTLLSIGFAYSVNFIFENVLLPHQKDRFNILLGKEFDTSGSGFNLYQSKVAIGSGGWTGRGWLNGTQTQGKFVPEQHTDYIFSTVGEEWGFIGSSLIVLLFTFLILRLFYLAERQKSRFSRIYGYSVVAILFFHFFVNIAMVLGLFPTVGIPLPFFSYGGSGLWGFTLLIFVFLKLDAKRMDL
ncbi:MAG: rod shape-determining protein RodA [Bacteroidota bacterium]